MKINKLEYQSSYIITDNIFDNILKNYSKAKVGRLNIYYDRHTDILLKELNNKSILLLGYCFDIRSGMKDQEDTLIDLLISKDLHSELDYINGRYIIVIKNEKGEYFIYSDASQLRPLVYHHSSKILASHDSLLNELLVNLDYEINKRDHRKHNELDYTRFYEIYKFNPSLYLSYNDFNFVRFYPREQLKESTSKKVFYDLKKYLNESITYLEKVNNDIFVTVTGGIDSRVSAALTRDFSNKVKYLTYTQPKNKLATKMAKKIYEIDEQIAKEMRVYLGWNHTIINLEEYKLTKENNRINNIKFNSKHSYALSKYYRDTMKYYKAFHVKSTVFGMGKADFPKELDNNEENLEFYKKCIHGIPKDILNTKTIETEINEYFKRNKVYEGVTKGRHYFDLYHLESRMGNWHSMLTLETDPETEEFIFTNTRKAIDLIQQPSIKERRNFELYKQIINDYWPVLLKFSINKISIKKSSQSIKNETLLYNQMEITALNKINLDEETNSIKVKPATNLVSIYENYSFSLKSHTLDSKKIRIKSFYKNIKSKGKISVIIRTDKKIKVYDILDLNNGTEITIGEVPTIFSIVYSNNFVKSSWVDAGRLSIEILE